MGPQQRRPQQRGDFESMRSRKATKALAAYQDALARGADPMELRLLYEALRRSTQATHRLW